MFESRFEEEYHHTPLEKKTKMNLDEIYLCFQEHLGITDKNCHLLRCLTNKMPKSYKDILNTVSKKIGRNCLEALSTYVHRKNPSLWGEIKRKDFIRRSLVIALYKDLESVGYCKLRNEVHSWYPPTAKSLLNNQKKLRVICANWAKKQIRMPTVAVLRHRSQTAKLPLEVEDTVGWMDSTDFRLEGKRKTSRKHSSWSFKANGHSLMLDKKLFKCGQEIPLKFMIFVGCLNRFHSRLFPDL